MMISMNKKQQGAQEECNNVARGQEESNRQSGTPERETGQQDPKIPSQVSIYGVGLTKPS